MRKIIAAAALTIFTAGTAMAADTITLPAKNGDITFPHKKHQELLKDCKLCHEKGPGKIEGLGKDWAQEKKAGPTKCAECHKK